MKITFKVIVACGVLLALAACHNFSKAGTVDDEHEVERILADLDNLSLTTEQQLRNYSLDAVILAPDQKEIRGHEALKVHLDGFGANNDISLNHQIVELSSFDELVVAQGRVVGRYSPNPTESHEFETKNVILFKRDTSETLKIWKVIYNSAPLN